MDECQKKIAELACPACGTAGFELRASSDEGIASARCTGCDRTFLLLDSEDFWLDAIQTSSPRVRRCSCKETSLELKLVYLFRTDNEVKSVDLWSRCSGCNRSERQTHVKIDYAPTADLVARPLRYCAHPNLRYGLNEVFLYLDKADVVSIVRHLGAAREANIIASVWEGERRVLRRLDANFVGWRGKRCFDNRAEHLRIFGDRFRAALKAPRA